MFRSLAKFCCEPASPVLAKATDLLINSFIEDCTEEELSEDEMKSELENFLLTAPEVAADSIRWVFIAQAIAKKESLELTQQECREYIEDFIENRDYSLPELMQECDENQITSFFYAQAVQKKVLKFLRARAKIIEVARSWRPYLSLRITETALT